MVAFPSEVVSPVGTVAAGGAPRREELPHLIIFIFVLMLGLLATCFF